jgi:hypothetical protein
MQNLRFAFIATFALSIACISGGGARGYRLYPPAPQPLPPDQVSTLAGYVQFVDNQDVSSLGGYFELLPGCHVIGTPSHWGDQSAGGSVAVTATTGRWIFALPMRAGHRYRIEVAVPVMTGVTGTLTIKGRESDLAGNKTREFEHVTSVKDIQACFAEAPAAKAH